MGIDFREHIMATIAEFQISASDTALGATFEAVPILVCEVEQVIAADGLGIWLSGANLLTINSALEADPTVVEHSVITGHDDRWLCNIGFSDDISNLFFVVVEAGGTMLAATAKNGIWTIRLRFPVRQDASRVYEQLTEQDIQVDITQLQTLSKATGDEIGLTPEQYEALTAAIQYGFFEIPRDISMEELADELEISHQALSERLCRAYRTLVTPELEITEEVGTQFMEGG